MAHVTVLITSKDRKDELRRAVTSALAQSVPLEVFVFDDGSSDGTSDMIRAEFPQVRVERSEEPLGIIVGRTTAIGMVTSPIVITIDDDCVFVSTETVAQTLAEFDHPRVGVVAIPSIDVLESDEIKYAAPDRNACYLSRAFRGGANAMRRDVFVQLGGYRSVLWRQGEETDYGVRLLAAGYVVRLGTAAPLHHIESPNRNYATVHFYAARNNLLFAWHNVPWPYLPLHAVGTIGNSLGAGISRGQIGAAFRGVGSALRAMLSRAARRAPVSSPVYKLHRRLTTTSTSTPLTLDAVEVDLPPLSRIKG